ncbi:DUF3800 domain-containing protein [Brevibacterium sp. Marseille-P9724]|uniref:DUF3800 domain-containing protein n=1 Tax=Brevibacterium sp. Marseille-P9724 TaxID=2614125 RepID=UPI001D015C83|nr:DUF3800 domain-containing protein [Brevibacterium sp. Marseille-P9724]
MDTARPLYVYVDESGDMEFSAKGSDHFVMSAVITRNPVDTAAKVLALKYELMQHDMERPYFHATEDSPGVRKRMFDTIESLPQFTIRSLWADKHYASPRIHDQGKFYSIFAGALARYIRNAADGRASSVVMVYDAAITKKNQKAFHAKMKPELKADGTKMRIHFDSIKHDPVGQVADYVAWSHFRSLERADDQYWKRIKELQSADVSDHNTFLEGHTRYW